MAEKQYHRLTRTRARSGFSVAMVSRSSLWLGKDHLLLVDTTGFTESYKRFYFRDIQSISFYRTTRWNIWSALLGGLFISSMLIGLATGERAGLISFAIIAGVFAIGLIANLAMGPSCRCYLRTAVQTEELGSVSRIGKANKILNRIRPLIAAVQGQLTPDEVAQKLRESIQPRLVSEPAATPAPTPVPETGAPPQMAT